jgi:hypothetical protein
MMSTWLSAAVALAPIALTYFICVRPHPQGRTRPVQSHSEKQAVDRQLADLRDELRALRTHHGFGVHPASGDRAMSMAPRMEAHECRKASQALSQTVRAGERRLASPHGRR